ncbi:unnamed protein product [Symbiodinium sp. CCMP2592]|nr:unnamed protein product [Symbiodinium sp. CCMP2592]
MTYKATKSDLQKKLASYGETPPTGWTKIQLTSRLNELMEDQEHIMTEREAAKLVNKCKTKQAVMEMLEEYALDYDKKQNSDQLRSKMLRHLMENLVPSTEANFMGFGKHSQATYGQVLATLPSYSEWCIKTESEEPECHWRLRRYARWAKNLSATQKQQVTRGLEAVERPSSSSYQRTRMGTPSTGSTAEWEMTGDMEMIPVETSTQDERIGELEQEVKELKELLKMSLKIQAEKEESSGWHLASTDGSLIQTMSLSCDGKHAKGRGVGWNQWKGFGKTKEFCRRVARYVERLDTWFQVARSVQETPEACFAADQASGAELSPDDPEGLQDIPSAERKRIFQNIRRIHTATGDLVYVWRRMTPRQEENVFWSQEERNAVEISERHLSEAELEGFRGTSPEDALDIDVARAVVLGYMDPLYEHRPTSSPTMSRTTRQMFLQNCANHDFRVEKGDISGAFLQGDDFGPERPMVCEPLPEICDALGVPRGQHMLLTKAAYGLVEDTNWSQLRSVLGALSWHANQVAPLWSTAVSMLLSRIHTGTGQEIVDTNKLLRKAKLSQHQKMYIHKQSPDQMLLAAWVDAADGSRPDGSSTKGVFIGWTHQRLLQGDLAKISPMFWQSAKIQRTCKSSGAAETRAAADAEDELYAVRFQAYEFSGHWIRQRTPPRRFSRLAPNMPRTTGSPSTTAEVGESLSPVRKVGMLWSMDKLAIDMTYEVTGKDRREERVSRARIVKAGRAPQQQSTFVEGSVVRIEEDLARAKETPRTRLGGFRICID